MNEVRSKAGLTADIVKAGVAAPQPVLEVAATALVAEKPLPIAIVGVHGISPIQQYAFQDQLADGMLSYLNAVEQVAQSGKSWLSSPYWPRVASGEKDPVLKPSALRLYRSDETSPDDPSSQVYDVYEGYWSPYSKGKTNVASLLNWLLTITFLATSSTARVPATGRKLAWDVGYVLGALAIAALCLAGAIVAGSFAWTAFIAAFSDDTGASATPTFLQFAFDPLHQIEHVHWFAWFQLALDAIVAYLLVQLVIVLWTRARTHRRTEELKQDAHRGGHFDSVTISAGAFHFWTAVVVAAALVVLLAVDVVTLSTFHPRGAGWVALLGAWLVVAVTLLQTARFLGNFVVENVLGDVQIYTTHDSNSSFYAIRQQIMDAVTKAILGALNAVDVTRLDADGTPQQLYRKIHVAAHSLGSTVALDALIRIRQLVNEKAVDVQRWSRIRSFTTFGTALEKTRFFFDVRQPTVSAAQQQWQNDVYGRFFTLAHRTLRQSDNRQGVYWSNHWYFRDVVATRIVSYRSDVRPGEEFHTWSTQPPRRTIPICRNVRLPSTKPPYAFVHGDYIGDAAFWKNVGPIFTS